MTLVRSVDSALVDSTRPPGVTHDRPGNDNASSASTTPGLQRWAVTSALIGFFLTVCVVTTVVAINGGGWASIAAGMMVAGFDGFPFGAMIGVMTYYMKYPESPRG